MEDLTELKSVGQIEMGIKMLLEINSSDNDAYQRIYDVIVNNLHPIPFLVMDLVPGLEYSFVYRARKNKKTEVFRHVSEISSHDNIENIEEFGRCNKPKQSTFYCAENRPVAQMEVLNKEILDNGKNIVLTCGKWLIKKRLKMAILLHSGDVMKVNPFIQQKYNELQIFLEREIPEKRIIINKLLGFFSNYFSRPFSELNHNEYKLSAAFYNYVLNYCDGLIYPSVKIKYEGLNYAFPHEIFKQGYIELDKVIMNVFEKDQIGDGFTDKYANVNTNIIKKEGIIDWDEQLLPQNKFNKSSLQ